MTMNLPVTVYSVSALYWIGHNRHSLCSVLFMRPGRNPFNKEEAIAVGLNKIEAAWDDKANGVLADATFANALVLHDIIEAV